MQLQYSTLFCCAASPAAIRSVSPPRLRLQPASAPFPTPRLPAARDKPKAEMSSLILPEHKRLLLEHGARRRSPRAGQDANICPRTTLPAASAPPILPNPERHARNLCTRNAQAIKIPRGGPMKHRPRRWEIKLGHVSLALSSVSRRAATRGRARAHYASMLKRAKGATFAAHAVGSGHCHWYTHTM